MAQGIGLSVKSRPAMPSMIKLEACHAFSLEKLLIVN